MICIFIIVEKNVWKFFKNAVQNISTVLKKKRDKKR